jgi:hypothetical protein
VGIPFDVFQLFFYDAKKRKILRWRERCFHAIIQPTKSEWKGGSEMPRRNHPKKKIRIRKTTGPRRETYQTEDQEEYEFGF